MLLRSKLAYGSYLALMFLFLRDRQTQKNQSKTKCVDVHQCNRCFSTMHPLEGEATEVW